MVEYSSYESISKKMTSLDEKQNRKLKKLQDSQIVDEPLDAAAKVIQVRKCEDISQGEAPHKPLRHQKLMCRSSETTPSAQHDKVMPLET